MNGLSVKPSESEPKATDEIELAFQGSTKIQEFPSQSCYSLNFLDSSITIQQNGKSVESTSDIVKSLEAQTFYFTTDLNHRVDSIYVNSDKDVLPILIVRSLLSHWVGNKPKNGTREEYETSGKFLVQYANTSANELTREVLGLKVDQEQFASMPGRSIIQPDTKIIGQSKLKFDDASHLSHVVSKRETTNYFAKKLASQSFEDVDLSLSIDSGKPSAETPDLKALSKIPLAARTNAEDSERILQSKELGSLTLADITKMIPAKWANNNDRTKVFLKLRALFYLKPEECSYAIQLSSASASTNQLVVDSLAATGSNEAQHALTELGQKLAGNQAAVQQILVSLTQLPRPSDELISYVCSLAINSNSERAVRYTAQLVCGSLARRLETTDSEAATSLNQFLDSQFESANSADDQLNLMYAIGNSARSEPPKTVLAFLNSNNPSLRAGVIHALRLSPGKNIDQLISEHLSKEQSQLVKTEGARVMSARKLVHKNQN